MSLLANSLANYSINFLAAVCKDTVKIIILKNIVMRIVPGKRIKDKDQGIKKRKQKFKIQNIKDLNPVAPAKVDPKYQEYQKQS